MQIFFIIHPHSNANLGTRFPFNVFNAGTSSFCVDVICKSCSMLIQNSLLISAHICRFCFSRASEVAWLLLGTRHMIQDMWNVDTGSMAKEPVVSSLAQSE